MGYANTDSIHGVNLNERTPVSPDSSTPTYSRLLDRLLSWSSQNSVRDECPTHTSQEGSADDFVVVRYSFEPLHGEVVCDISRETFVVFETPTSRVTTCS